jgi:hypothetical protein
MATGKEAVKGLSDFVNNMTCSPKEFVEANEHRTLQQNSFRVMWKCIEYWASLEDNQYDLRNEGTVKACKDLVRLFPNGPYLPFV